MWSDRILVFPYFSSSSKWDIHDWTKETCPIEYSAKINSEESEDYIDFKENNVQLYKWMFLLEHISHVNKAELKVDKVLGLFEFSNEDIIG